MAKFKYEFERSDGWEKGDCIGCALSYDDCDEYGELCSHCVLGANWDECPLEEE